MADTTTTRQRLVIATGINWIAEINRMIVENARKGTSAEFQLPTLFNRAFLVHHEAGVLPVTDTLTSE